MPTDHDQHDQDLADSIAAAVEGSRAPLNFPTEAEMIAARVERGMAPAAASSPPAPSQPSTGQLIAEHAAEDARQLDHFVQAIAEHFDCRSLLCDEVRGKVRPLFAELRAMARRLNAEAARRGAPLGQPASDLVFAKTRRAAESR